MIGFYHVLRALLSFLSSKEIFQLYLIDAFGIFYIIQIGFIKRLLLLPSVFTDVQEFADN